MAHPAGEEALKLAKTAWKMLVQGKGFEKNFQQVRIMSAGQGGCVAEFKVEEGITNRKGTLHGGYIATLVDCITTIGLMTDKVQKPGVSVNINVNYLREAKEGETIVVHSKTIKSGKTLAFLEVVLKKKDSDDIVARGSHVKFIGG